MRRRRWIEIGREKEKGGQGRGLSGGRRKGRRSSHKYSSNNINRQKREPNLAPELENIEIIEELKEAEKESQGTLSAA